MGAGILEKLVQMNSQLHESGITTGWLALIALLFGITFVLSTRELLLWFFRMHHLQAELNDLRNTMGRIERRLNEALALNSATASEVVVPTVTNEDAIVIAATTQPAAPKGKSFTLNH